MPEPSIWNMFENGMISLDKQLRLMLEAGDTSVDEAIRIGIK